jgi:hypothetical protein
MNRDQKISLINGLARGYISVDDLIPKQMSVLIDEERPQDPVLKIEDKIVSRDQWNRQFDAQLNLQCIQAGKYLHLFVNGEMRF